MLRLGAGLGVTDSQRFTGGGGGGGGGTAYNLVTIIVGAYSGGSYPVEITGDAADGTPVEWVLFSGTDTAIPAEVNAGAWSGATVVDTGATTFAASPSPVTLAPGIARGNYKLAAITNDSGTLSNNVVISAPFEVDTATPLLTLEAFADDGAEGMDIEFQPDKDVSYRWAIWADGSTPDETARAGGAGSVATGTGTATGGVLEVLNTGPLGAATYVPTLWVEHAYGVAYSEIYADVSVAANVLAADAGRIFHITSADVEMGVGDNVAKVINLEGSTADLSSIGAFNAPQKTGSGPLRFTSTAPGTVIQTPTADAGYRDHCQHLRGGGSNKIIMSAVVDAGSIVGTSGVVFSESPSDSSSNAFYFGVGNSGGNIRLVYTANNASSTNALSEGSFTTAVAATGMKIIQMEITQTTFEIWINNVSVRTGTVTAANFPNPTTARFNLGALASATVAAIRLQANLFEFFSTTSNNRSTIYAALAAKHGI